MIDAVKEALDVRFHHVVIVPKLELDRQFVYGIQGPHPRSIAITTAQEVLLVDGFEEAGGRHLQQLVFYGGESERAPPAGSFWEVVGPHAFMPLPPLL